MPLKLSTQVALSSTNNSLQVVAKLKKLLDLTCAIFTNVMQIASAKDGATISRLLKKRERANEVSIVRER